MLDLADITAEQRHDILIQAALDYMEHQDWYCAEFDPDPLVLDQLEHIYRDNPEPQPTPCSGSPIFDTGVTLALLWERDRRIEYEQALPVWRCDCGAAYKREEWGHGNQTVYSITADGLLDEIVGSTKGKRGIASQPRDDRYPVNNGSCPSCRVAFKTTLARQADPQTSLLFDLT
jgi:hypothetical protein